MLVTINTSSVYAMFGGFPVQGSIFRLNDLLRMLSMSVNPTGSLLNPPITMPMNTLGRADVSGGSGIGFVSATDTVPQTIVSAKMCLTVAGGAYSNGPRTSGYEQATFGLTYDTQGNRMGTVVGCDVTATLADRTAANKDRPVYPVVIKTLPFKSAVPYFSLGQSAGLVMVDEALVTRPVVLNDAFFNLEVADDTTNPAYSFGTAVEFEFAGAAGRWFLVSAGLQLTFNVSDVELPVLRLVVNMGGGSIIFGNSHLTRPGSSPISGSPSVGAASMWTDVNALRSSTSVIGASSSLQIPALTGSKQVTLGGGDVPYSVFHQCNIYTDKVNPSIDKADLYRMLPIFTIPGAEWT